MIFWWIEKQCALYLFSMKCTKKLSWVDSINYKSALEHRKYSLLSSWHYFSLRSCIKAHSFPGIMLCKLWSRSVGWNTKGEKFVFTYSLSHRGSIQPFLILSHFESYEVVIVHPVKKHCNKKKILSLKIITWARLTNGECAKSFRLCCITTCAKL